MKKMNELALAEYILGMYPNKDITPMKLQKLAYYSKVWTLVADQPLISAKFVKWDYGPVSKQIYHSYKKFGGDVIPVKEKSDGGGSWEKNELLMFILDNYIKLSAYELGTMTHSEDPWIKTPHGAVISDELIIDYYSKQAFAKNFSKASLKNGPFHLLQNEIWHSFTLDMGVDEKKDFESYSSYDEFLKQFQNAEFESQEFFKEVFD